MNNEKNGKERRRFLRRNITLHLHLVFEDLDELREAYTKDVSEGGIFVASEQPLKIGSKVRLKISLVHEDISYLDVSGEVMHNVKPGGGREPGMGIKFIDLSEHDSHFIKEYLERKN